MRAIWLNVQRRRHYILARHMQSLHLEMSRNENSLRRVSMHGRALKKICVVRYKNSTDIFNIKKIWGVLVRAKFVLALVGPGTYLVDPDEYKFISSREGLSPGKGAPLEGLGLWRARPSEALPRKGSAVEESGPGRARPALGGLGPGKARTSEGLTLCTQIRSECAPMTELETKVLG